MSKNNIPKNNNRIIYIKDESNINDKNINKENICPFCNSLRCNCLKANIPSLNEKNFLYNSKLISQDEIINNNKLNKGISKSIPLSNNYPIENIPNSSRCKKKMEINFQFYNNADNKTINQINENYEAKNIQKKNEVLNIRKEKNNLIDKRLLFKKTLRQNYSVSSRCVHDFLNNLGAVNSLYESTQLYQTPKNIIAEKRKTNLKENKEKVKYKKIFINNYNIEKKPMSKNFSIKDRECITPFINNKFKQKININKLRRSSNNINKNNNNINTDINNINNNNLIKEYNRHLNYNYQLNLDSNTRKKQPKNSNDLKRPQRINYPSTNFEEFICINNPLNLNDSLKLRKKFQENKDKETLELGKFSLYDNYNAYDIDKKNNFNGNRFTQYESRINNNIIYTTFENSKRFFNNENNMYYNIDISQDNKENINNINLNIEDSILKDSEKDDLYFKSKLNQKLYKKINEKYNIQKNNKKLSLINDNINNNKNIVSKNTLENNSNIIKSSFSLNNDIIKQDNESGNNLKKEINNYKLKTVQLMSLLKKANNEISKLKDELKDYKSQNEILEKNIKNNETKNYNVEPRLKRYRYNTSKINIKLSNNQYNYQKNNIKINIPENIILKTKLNKKKKIKINTSINSNNTNADLFFKNSSLLNKSKLYSQQNQTTLNTSDLSKANSNSYKSKFLIQNEIKSINKNIFSIYYSMNILNKKKNFQISVISFEPEECAFKVKNIENMGSFHKNFYESIDKENNENKSIFLNKNGEYFIVTGGNINKFYKYNFLENKMEQKCDLKYNHSNGGMINFNEQVICIGGNYNKKVEVYFENNNMWAELPEIQIERSHFSSCIIKDRFLFIFFGYNYPTKTYLDSIEFFDIFNYNYNLMNKKASSKDKNFKNSNNIYWKYLKYNFFSSTSSFKSINLIGSIAINFNNEKIIFLGGKNCLYRDDNNGYYQLILDFNNMDGNENEITSYIEKIKTNDLNKFENNYFFTFDYKYIEGINKNNIMNEPIFVAFDRNYFVHLIKLSTMNHEIYQFK